MLTEQGAEQKGIQFLYPLLALQSFFDISIGKR